ncbi:ABC transporter permease [Chondromyces crocatus]|uniref:Branched-chain amino acid ABC transporter permease n=1 Tax=Chondromyces crocatus TaxID=52 RepID=A0A0K1E755_CHOCO|nr:ABC transporter permease [Chondromyces crocatus]AKT36690.1 branched-chain amino acid ABC transporter permease [Chondromyces crocatus]
METRRHAFVALIVAVLIGAAVLAGVPRVSAASIVASMIATTIAVATPLILGALSGVLCERAGVVNLGIEGMMLTAAFFGWASASYASTVWGLPPSISLLLGVAGAIISGGLLGLVHAALSVTFRVDQIIGGTVINLLAVGLTGFLNRQLFFGSGSSSGVSYASPGVLPRVHLPGLADLPVVGRVFEQQPITLAAIALVVVTHIALFRTRWGLRVRAVGEHPQAAATVGIDVRRMRYQSVILGGCVAGLGGAYFTLESVPSFEPLMTNGRGFIALAAMIFGNWTPTGALAAALLFGSAQALQINLQMFREQLSGAWSFLQHSSIVGLLPYLLTLLILTGVIGRTTPPAADGKPYDG